MRRWYEVGQMQIMKDTKTHTHKVYRHKDNELRLQQLKDSGDSLDITIWFILLIQRLSLIRSSCLCVAWIKYFKILEDRVVSSWLNVGKYGRMIGMLRKFTSQRSDAQMLWSSSTSVAELGYFKAVIWP